MHAPKRALKKSTVHNIFSFYLLHQLTFKQIWKSEKLMALLVSGWSVPREAHLN